jgi:glyoxylase-like metal-dependent hydrolase (beta-lactamase superfamily II)/8-oxo-dGTP pyrophosphatase MutT (NUDIX family)
MNKTSAPDSGAMTARSWRPTPGAAVRLAATVVVLRDHPGSGMQLLLMRRKPRPGDIHSGACVFPGGLVDSSDRAGHAVCRGIDDARASAALNVSSGGLDYYFAAMRECFEEAGLLFAAGAEPAADVLGQIAALRPAVNRGELSLPELCARFGLSLAADRLVYLDHWLTPPGVPKRYDTRFFVTRAPDLQVASQDDSETDGQLWITPADALAQRRELLLAPPTFKTIELLQRLGDIDKVLGHARALLQVPCIMPRLAQGSKGLRPVLPDEPAYAELGRLDPEGHARFSYELAPGVAVPLSARLIRVTANNGSMMTGPGTNCYLIGGGATNEWAVLDPGPSDEAHVQAIIDAAPGPIRWIFVTHTHKDHSPAAQALKARTGAALHGMAALLAEWQDTDFVPDVPLRGGEVFALPGNSTLRVIHTPGHAGNHLCYVLDEERLMFTGDHVMQGSTVVINPPDGDMGAYLRSLRELMQLDIDWLAPGHGFLMPQPRRAMQQIVDHRLKREAKVWSAVADERARPVDALLAAVYDDVPLKLHAMARRSLLAHLLKLRDDGRVVEAPPGHWARVHG